jgi:glucose-6-phosphate isomerase
VTGSEFPAAAQAAGVFVSSRGADLVAARDRVLGEAIAGGVPAGIVAKDAGQWGPEAAELAATRLGWLDCSTVSRDLVPRIESLREEFRTEGVTRIVLAGMGGSSLAPEVITRTYAVDLVVLDTTDPGQVRRALSDDLDRTAIVVSSKSGGTLETDSHHRVFRAAFEAAGIDPAQRIVVVTDPGSPLEKLARDLGVREVFLADPDVGGRYSALTAFGLVPSGLAGVPVGELLDQAAAVQPSLAQAADNPALWLGAALGGFGVDGHDKVVIADAGSGIVGFGDWAEQLLAESTGKNGRGLLPVVVAGTNSPGFTETGDAHLVTLVASTAAGEGTAAADTPATGTTVSGPLGAQLLVWEFATAIAGWALRIDPFDQPNVQESKDNTNKVLEAAADVGLPASEPTAVDAAIEIHADASLGDAGSVRAALESLLAAIPDHGYLAVMAYLDREIDAGVSGIRDLLAQRTDRAVTFGWGPRFLHSTGQYHKGGPQVGAFLQITGAPDGDVPIPDRDFDFTTLQVAQAIGDSQALTSRGRPFLRLHVTDRADGVAALLAAALPGGARP